MWLLQFIRFLTHPLADGFARNDRPKLSFRLKNWMLSNFEGEILIIIPSLQRSLLSEEVRNK